MLRCDAERAEFQQRIASIRLLLDEAHPQGHATAISREVRGIAIVLLYAAYENLLKSVCRSTLETAARLRVGNRRLRPGLKLIAAYGKFQAVASSKPTTIWKVGFDVVDTLHESQQCSILPNTFPNDGSNFRQSQISTVCKVLGLSDPAPVLREAWEKVNAVVAERNSIAHGQRAPGEVGRNYSLAELTDLVDIWEVRWNDFLDWLEQSASNRDFFRTP
ncbi:MAE_28990/MAE_18760 family HEPN-like nuclease [Micromonospora sp. NPDC005220]|uniref:MAE_28990/MAE_18760 family HEPN-like nuclease n=1 Tax=Micromonospora sp. NPDC005220 TaxID=3155589 RepID=UPI0033A04A1A